MHKTLTTVFLIGLFFLSSPLIALGQQGSSQTKDEWTGSTEQKIWGLMTVWSEAKYTFPHFDRLSGLDWDQTVKEYIPRVIEADDMDSYYMVLMELVALLKDSHTSIIPPWGHFKPGYDLPPIEVQVVGDKFLIARIGENDELESQRIYAGLEILETGDNVPIRTHFDEHVMKYHSQGSKQADEAVLMIYLFYGPQGGKVRLKVKDMDGTVRNVTLTRNAMSSGGPPFMYRFVHDMMVAQTIRSEVLEDNILYVHIPNFESNQVQVDFLKLVDGQDLSEINGLIIDLRYNMGGSSSISNAIVGCLIDETVSSPTMKYRHHVGAEEAWGREPRWSTENIEVLPRDGKRYLGPLVILSGPTTHSSAEDFIIELQYNGRATIVGETTAGGAGNALVSGLPGGGSFMVSTFTALYPGGQDYVGTGVEPDLMVRPTQEDIFEGKDPVLERAMQAVKDSHN